MRIVIDILLRKFVGEAYVKSFKGSYWNIDQVWILVRVNTPHSSIDASTLSLFASSAMNFDKKDEDSEVLFHLDKTQVFQEARAFNASSIQPKKCRIILTKIKCTSLLGLVIPLLIVV
jgi:hypothetical protein